MLPLSHHQEVFENVLTEESECSGGGLEFGRVRDTLDLAVCINVLDRADTIVRSPVCDAGTVTYRRVHTTKRVSVPVSPFFSLTTFYTVQKRETYSTTMTFAGSVHPFLIAQIRNCSFVTPAPTRAYRLFSSPGVSTGASSIWLKSVGGPLTLAATSAEVPVATARGINEIKTCESAEYRSDQVCRNPATRTNWLFKVAYLTMFCTPMTVVGMYMIGSLVTVLLQFVNESATVCRGLTRLVEERGRKWNFYVLSVAFV